MVARLWRASPLYKTRKQSEQSDYRTREPKDYRDKGLRVKGLKRKPKDNA